MTNKQTGGPAFGAHPESANWHPSWQGMTLRDYFAAKAMQGIQSRVNWSIESIADLAYKQADEMLKAREQ